MRAISEKRTIQGALVGIIIFLLGIYWIFSREDFIVLERWDQYLYLSLYFLGPVFGIIAAFRILFYEQNPLSIKLMWWAVLITCISFVIALIYGISLELK